MPDIVRVVPWLVGTCSLYAIVRSEICLPDQFIEILGLFDRDSADRLLKFIKRITYAGQIRELHLRPERPDLGVFAMYNHRELLYEPYNPSRLLCAYIHESNRIMIVGAGFIKSKAEPIQSNAEANDEAKYLADIVRQLNNRIDHGEVLIVGSELIPVFPDSLEF